MSVVYHPSEGFVTGGGGAGKFCVNIWDACGIVHDSMIGYSKDMTASIPRRLEVAT